KRQNNAHNGCEQDKIGEESRGYEPVRWSDQQFRDTAREQNEYEYDRESDVNGHREAKNRDGKPLIRSSALEHDMCGPAAQRDRNKPRQGVVAKTLETIRNGGVGFIDWLDRFERPHDDEKANQSPCDNTARDHIRRVARFRTALCKINHKT